MTKEPTIDIAEATGFALLSMVKATSPVNGNVTLVSAQSGCTLCDDAAESTDQTVALGTPVGPTH